MRPRLILSPIVVNAIVCGVIGLTFGILTGNLLLWLIGGVLIGAATGMLSEAVFNRLRSHATLYRVRSVLLVLIEALLTIYVVVPIYAGYKTVHPDRLPLPVTPSDFGLAYQDVTLKTQDGLRLKGWYIPSRNGAAIIAVHGFNGNRSHVMLHAQTLAEHGYGVLAFDMRGHGESEGVFAAAWTSDLDVLAAVEHLQRQPDVQAGRIGALGLSSGAHALLNGAARSEAIRALIADGAGASRVEDAINPMLPEIQGYWFMVPMVWFTDRMTEAWSGAQAAPPFREQVRRIAPRPILFIAAGQADYEISVARRYAASAGPTAQVWALPEAHHVGGIVERPEEYRQRMLDFFDANLTGK